MKRVLSFSLLASLALVGLPASAIKDGVSVPGHPRIVPIYFKLPKWNNAVQSCTGFLYSPRIVLTAAHCVHDGTQFPKKVPLKASEMFVGKPGIETGPSVKKYPVAKIFQQQGFETYRGYSYTNDFAVIVLKSPLARVDEAKLASQTDIETLIKSNALVSTGGYGGTSEEDADKGGDPNRRIFPQFAQFRLIDFEDGIRSVRERMSMWRRDYYQSDGVSFMRYEPGTAHPCNGDSGSGFFIEDKGVFTYLGVTWPGVHPLCEAGDLSKEPRFIPASGQVVAFRGVFMDANVVDEAKKYVLAFPSNTFLSCMDLNAVYKTGITNVGRPTNRGAGPVLPPKYSPPIYRMNAGLDRDKDGIACEVQTKKP